MLRCVEEEDVGNGFWRVWFKCFWISGILLKHFTAEWGVLETVYSEMSQLLLGNIEGEEFWSFVSIWELTLFGEILIEKAVFRVLPESYMGQYCQVCS